ncbi:MAG: glycosyltransferase [Gammaproteobacteria bacterium]|nr:glycosyltransferase [Gammaproteobacteria bacterium]
MPKILHIIPSLNCGGVEKSLLDIYPFLSKKFSHLICPFLHTGALYTDAINLEKSKNNGFWLYIFKSHTLVAKALKPLLFFYYTYRTQQFLKNENPDVIITYTDVSAFVLIFLKMLTNQKAKFKWYARIDSHMVPANSHPFFSNKKFIYRIVSGVVRFITGLFVERADCVITVSHALMNEVITACRADPKKFFLLPNCISNKPTASDYPLENSPFFVAAGRLEYVKGFDFLIKTFAIFSKNNPGVKLIIFGDGSRRKSLEKIIESLNMKEKILLPGFVKNPTSNHLKAIATIVPSRSESFGKIIVEAMQTSSIVIASNCGGPREIITDNIDGLLFENGNSVALLNVMNCVMQMSDQDKSRIKNSAYQKSLHYTPERVTALLNAKLEMD